MRRSTHFFVILLLFWTSSCCKLNRDSDWEKVYEELHERVTGDFVFKQLSYFAGWRLHQGGTPENILLANKQLRDWREWGWPIVETVNLSVRLPRGPPDAGPWNEVSILDRSSLQKIHQAQNYVTFNCTDFQPHSRRTCSRVEHIAAPVYSAYSAPGVALGRPVFVNYARSSDLSVFQNASDLCSKDVVALVRHGWTSYGSKVRHIVKFCETMANGTLPGGMVVFKDLTESAPPDGSVYPEGIGIPGDGIAFRSASMSKDGGDVETPGLPSIDGVYKFENLEEKALTPIPVQPISFDDAKVIMNSMAGKPVPEAWKPCSPKFLGPEGDSLIQLKVRNRVDKEPSTLVNVVGVMPGRGPEAHQYVTLGNHRDAWVQGASDPHSGTAVLQGVAYLLGLAYQQGWRPRRTIVIASWDAEEVGLVGSTEFTELHREELVSRAVVHLNQDCPVKGNATFVPRADEFLEAALLASAKAARGPCDAGVSLLDFWRKHRKEVEEEAVTLPVGGSTDHVPFQYKLGIPSTYPEFRPAPPLFEAPSYHTAYDSVTMATNFTDPPCSSDGSVLPLHRLLVRLHFHLALSFSSARRLPIHPVRKATTLKEAWDVLVSEAQQRYPDLEEHYGIKLEYVTKRIDDFLNASRIFENFVGNLHGSDMRCFHIYNDILGRLSKQFISNVDAKSPRHVLVDTAYTQSHAASYFPRIRTLLHQLELGEDRDVRTMLKSLKVELSALVTAFNAASTLLRGGLFGSLDAYHAHLCY